MSTAYPINMPIQPKSCSVPESAGLAFARGSSPLDWAFLIFTAMIPIEPAIQSALGVDFAFGRLILPVLAMLLLLNRVPGSRFTLPPRLLWCVPWFVVALYHIVVSGDWFPVYNYRSYLLNAGCSVLVYNYAKSHMPSVNAVLTAFVVGVGIFALLCQAGAIEYGERGGRLRIYELDENGVGGIFGFGAVTALILCIRKRYSITLKILFSVVGILCLAFTIGTGSRGAFAALAITIFAVAGYLAFCRRSVSFLIGVTAFAILGLTARSFYNQSEIMKRRLDTTFDESATNAERFGHRDVIFFESCRMVIEKPFFGWGEKPAWDALGARLRRGGSSHMGTHNTYMQAIVTGGVLFGGMFVWFMLQPVVTARRFLADPDYSALLFLMLHFYIASLTLDQIGYRLWWWILPLLLVRQQQLIAQAACHGSPIAIPSHNAARRRIEFAAGGAA